EWLDLLRQRDAAASRQHQADRPRGPSLAADRRGHPHGAMTLRLAPAPAMADFLERAALSVVAGPVESPSLDGSGPLRCGVDLGTATIVLAIVDEALEPVYCDAVPSQAVRDGVVVDFHGAAESVARLKERAEELLGRP